MNVILDYWSIRWRSVLFNTDKGVGKIRWLLKKPESCRGWAYKNKGDWFALLNSDAGLVFHVGKKHWNMEEFECSHMFQGSKGFFKIHRSKVTEYSIEYSAYKGVMLDDLDLEMEDYFFWVSRVWNDSNTKLKLRSAWEVTEIT